MARVPDFFVLEDDAARRAQVGWMHDAIGLEPAFFGGLLGCTVQRFEAWRDDGGDLPASGPARLSALWELTRHLLSFCGDDLERTHALFHASVDPSGSPLAPPWQGTTLRDYLVRDGDFALEDALRWVTALRFGEFYRPGPTPASAVAEPPSPHSAVG